MFKYIFYVLVFCCWLHAGAQLKGIVINGSTKIPISGAQVTILQFDQSTFTDSSGRFVFLGQFPLVVQIKVQSAGYEMEMISLSAADLDAKIELKEKHINLEEVTIAGVKQSAQRTSPFAISSRKLSDLNAVGNTTLVEAMSTMPGVYQSTTGIGIGKPVIRGLQGIRVVSLLNGLRIENQQWGGDHGLGVAELGIGTVEVIKGPASLLYGADAMGGVVYFIDEPYAPQQSLQVGLQSQNESNTLGTSNQLSLKQSGPRFRWSLYGRFSSHADYQLPNGKFAQNSRFQDQSIKAAVGTNTKNYSLNVRYTYLKNQAGIPGHSHDSIIDPSQFQVTDRKRERTIPVQVFNNHYLSIDQKLFMKRADWSMLMGQTFNTLTEYEEKVTIPGIDVFQSNTLAQLKLDYRFKKGWSWVSGLQGSLQRIKNAAGAMEYLLPDAQQIDAGVYSLLRWALEKWNWQAGIRYDVRMLEAAELKDQFTQFSSNYQGVNYALGGVRNATNSTFRFNASSGFRSPHFSELVSNGVHHGTMRYEIGNTELRPEIANQMDVTYEYHTEHLEWSINPFYALMNDYIVLTPLDSTIEGLAVYKYDQLKRIHLAGFDVTGHYHPHFAHRFHLESTYSWLYSQTGDGSSLPLMPQNRWSTTVKFSTGMTKKVQLTEIITQYIIHFGQYRTALNETTSAPYHLVHIAANFKLQLKHPIGIRLGVKNLFNTAYIDHLSRLKTIGMDNPGRNIYIAINYQFNQSLKSKK